MFAAAGITADREPITRQVRRWTFSHPTQNDRDQHAALRAAARFVRERAECFPGGVGPRDPVHVALLAIKVHDVFLESGDESGATGHASSDLDIARAVMEANDKFEAVRAATQPSPGAVRPDEPEG